MAQCLSEERFMIWRANILSSWLVKRHPRNKNCLPVRLC
jgi:hypothetical protein